MRSSRETEIADHYPIHTVCAWQGNTPRIALRHYLQVKPDDFRRAADDTVKSGAETRTSRAK